MSFGSINVDATVISTTRTRTNSKTESYFRARAMDECLGGFLSQNTVGCMNGRSHSLLFTMSVLMHWRRMNHTPAHVASGAFGFSARECARFVSDEEHKSRANQPAYVKRGPSSTFDDTVRTTYAELRDIVDGGPESIPEHYFYRVRFWNEQRGNKYLPDVPNVDRADELGMTVDFIDGKGHDTACGIEYAEPSEDERAALYAAIRDNLQDMSDWTYRAPTKLAAGLYRD